jgi:hypothetical protein
VSDRPAQDLGDQVRVQVEEVKVSEKLLPWAEALKLAQKQVSISEAASLNFSQQALN